MHAADERIKAEIREAERRRGQVMDEVRAVETELKALIRRGQREILARRQGAVCGIRQRNGRLGGVSGGALRAFGTAGQAVLLGHLGCGTGRRVGRRR